MNVLITGATGFLGYHITCACLKSEHHVLCMKRGTSISPFPKEYEDKIHWFIDKDPSSYDIVNTFQPEVLIHCAWSGVSADSRNDKLIQYQNLQLFLDTINLYPFQQIIGLGSQDEYGFLDSIVDENNLLCPGSEYARNKILCCEKLKSLSIEREYEWQWIRVFNVYGDKQEANWIIPSVIQRCINNEEVMKTTKGEQRYAYLYIEDFVSAIVSVIGTRGKSGIYNLSSSNPISLRALLLKIKEMTGSSLIFDFGAFSYRPNQSMIVCGNSKKFINAFGVFEKISLEEGLKRMIQSIKNESI